MKFKVEISERVMRTGHYIVDAESDEEAEENVECLLSEERITKNDITWDDKTVPQGITVGVATYFDD